jgi:hypothetical protein
MLSGAGLVGGHVRLRREQVGANGAGDGCGGVGLGVHCIEGARSHGRDRGVPTVFGLRVFRWASGHSDLSQHDYGTVVEYGDQVWALPPAQAFRPAGSAPRRSVCRNRSSTIVTRTSALARGAWGLRHNLGFCHGLDVALAGLL